MYSQESIGTEVWLMLEIRGGGRKVRREYWSRTHFPERKGGRGIACSKWKNELKVCLHEMVVLEQLSPKNSLGKTHKFLKALQASLEIPQFSKQLSAHHWQVNGIANCRLLQFYTRTEVWCMWLQGMLWHLNWYWCLPFESEREGWGGSYSTVNRVTGWGCPSKIGEAQMRLQMVPLFPLMTWGYRECACSRLCLINL